jgi:hypothetical protein
MSFQSPPKKIKASSNADIFESVTKSVTSLTRSLTKSFTDGLTKSFTDGFAIFSRDAHESLRVLAPDMQANKEDDYEYEYEYEEDKNEKDEYEDGNDDEKAKGDKDSDDYDEGNGDEDEERCDKGSNKASNEAKVEEGYDKVLKDYDAACDKEKELKAKVDKQSEVLYLIRRKVVIQLLNRLFTEWSSTRDLVSQDLVMSWCHARVQIKNSTRAERLSKELFDLTPELSGSLSNLILGSAALRECKTKLRNKNSVNLKIVPELHCMLLVHSLQTVDTKELRFEESSASVQVPLRSFQLYDNLPLSKPATVNVVKRLRSLVHIEKRRSQSVRSVVEPHTNRGSARISGNAPDFSISTAGGDDTRLKSIDCIKELIGTVIDSKNQGWNIILWIGIGRCEEALEILKNEAWCEENRIKIFGVELNNYADLTENDVKSNRLAVQFGTDAAFKLADALTKHFPDAWGIGAACHVIGYTTALIGPQFSHLLMKQMHKIEAHFKSMRFTYMTGFTKQIKPFTDALLIRSRGISGTTVGNTSFSMNYVHRDDFLSDEDLDSSLRIDALIDCNNILKSRFSRSFQGNSDIFFFPKPANYHQVRELMRMNVNADTPDQMKKAVETLREIYEWAWHRTDKDFSDQLLEFMDEQNHPWSKKVRSYLRNPAEYKSNFENVARPKVQPLSRKRLLINPRDEVEENTTDTEEDHEAKKMEPWEYVNEALENLTLKTLSRKSKELRLGLENSYNMALKHLAENANITRNTRPITIAIGMVMLSNESAANLRVNDSMNIKDSKALDTIRIKNLLHREKINENDLLTMSIGITGFSNSKYEYSKNCHEADCTNEDAVFKVVEPYILYKKVGRVIIDYNRVTGDYFNNILRGQTGKSILQIRVFAAAMAKGAAIYIPWPSPRNINDLEAFLNDLGGDVCGLFDIQIQPLGTHPFYEVDEHLIGKGEKSRVGIDHSIPEYQKCAPLVIMLRNNMEYEYQ